MVYRMLAVISIFLFCRMANAGTMYLNWTVKYASRNPDGVFRTVVLINDGVEDRFPCPEVRVTLGDTIVASVTNALPSDTVSIHWHGQHQRGTPYMDGVPYITQLPILPHATMVYTFKASQPGTHWYHSHSGTQYGDGLFGALIVEDPNDPYKRIPELPVLLVNEWFHRLTTDISAELAADAFQTNGYFPLYESGLLNGMGRYNCSAPFTPPPVTPELSCVPNTPYPIFNVTAGQDYRLRIISATAGVSFMFSIDSHNFDIIAIDGVYVGTQDFNFNGIRVYVSQRYDIILRANQAPDNYLIRFQSGNRSVPINQMQMIYGILHYSGASDPTTVQPTMLPDMPPTVVVKNSLHPMSLHPTNANLLNPSFTMPLNPPTITRQLVLNISCSNTSYYCEINGQSLHFSGTTPEIYNAYYSQPSNPAVQIISQQQGEVIQVIFNNLGVGDMAHPMHLHGHYFYVVGVGEVGAGIYNPATAALNFTNPPIRDTEQLPEFSWLSWVFVANNPGVWFMHCHIEWHLDAGLALAFELRPGIPPPPPNFYAVVTASEQPALCDSDSHSHLETAVIALASVLAIALIAVCLLSYCYCKNKGYNKIPS